jgi:membrane-associated protease RseP (regulator of RpoE activity)
VVNWDTVSIIVFYSLLFLFFITHRERFTMQAKIFAMYKTKLGLKLMDKIAKIAPKFLKGVGYVGVVVGFIGMIAMLYILVKETLALIFVPGTAPALAPVLPGIAIPGAPALSFWHWVITIFFAAAIHECCHGIWARVHNIKVKSSGFAFLGPILAAFVEPDEKQLSKTSKWAQLSVFAAGPFSNIVTGILIIVLSGLLISPVVGNLYQAEGIVVQELLEGYPMADTDAVIPLTILSLNGVDTLDGASFAQETLNLKPGDEVTLGTDQGEFTIVLGTNPDNDEAAFFGIGGLTQEQSFKDQYVHLEKFEGVINWFTLLLVWLFIISIGIGLFNLLPIGPVDGGRMFLVAALWVFKNDEKKAMKALSIISTIILGIIIINMIPWIWKLFTWVGSGVGALVLLV